MSLPPSSVADILTRHVTLEVEGIDRMYLNIYVPQLQREQGVVNFFRFHRGHQFASSALMDPITRTFVSALEEFARREKIPVIEFRKGQRKDDIAAEFFRLFRQAEGVVFIGKAQEKTPVFRTERRRNPKTGVTFPWIVRSTAIVNQFYIYCLDRDFGPFFLKFSTYFPYNAKLCLNGHEYAKRQLQQKGIGFQALDNGVLECDDPKRLQAICDGLSAEKIDALLRKWLRRLPHPFTRADRRAGYRYDVSILQAEFSLTQVLDRPVTGRVFFEEVIRENLDLGRPGQVQLIFDRRVTRRTPGRFRTRVITDGVIPSLHVDYKNTRIKQYHKEGRALRTETTINNTRDFGIGRKLKNLPELRQIGFQANRRLLDVEKVSHDCSIGEDAFDQVVRPIEVDGQRASALRFGDRRVTRRTPGRFRTRVITDGVIPSLHVDYKNTRIKQYHKEGRALRTETTINDTRDFGIGRKLKNLPELRQIGFQANRRLLDVQKVSHDCSIGEDAFDAVVRPIEVEGQRASALRFGDKRVQALCAVLVIFSLQLRGFSNADMRLLLAQLLGLDPAQYPAARMTYDLRRLRLHGFIARIPHSHRYELTPAGLRIALFFSRTYSRLLRPKLAEIMPTAPPVRSALRSAFERVEAQIHACCKYQKLAA